MKSDYRTRAFQFLKSIFPYIENSLFSEWDVKQAVGRYICDHPSRRISSEAGSARIALLTSDYVIKWDYDAECVAEIGGCEREAAVYKMACDAGYEYLFAETTLITYRGYIFSIMPRIKAIGPNCHKYTFEQMLSYDELSWIRSIGLTDFHDWNWGIRHHQPVIVDYAYIEECEDEETA